MEIRVAKDEKDSIAASFIYAMGWKSGYKGIFTEKLLANILLDNWVNLFNANLITKRSEIAILNVDGEDVGAGGYGLSRDYNDSEIGEITSIYFLEKAWGKGYAKNLMDFMTKQLRKKGYKRVNIWVLSENIRAQKFYEKYGFKRTGNEKSATIKGEGIINFEYIIDFDEV